MGWAHCLSGDDRWRIVQLTGELTRRRDGKRLGSSLFRGDLSRKTEGEVRFPIGASSPQFWGRRRRQNQGLFSHELMMGLN